MKNCMTAAISSTIYVVLSFLLIYLIWKFNISPLMVLLIVILNDVTTMTMSMDWSKPSSMPDAWVLREIFGTSVLLGGGLAWITISFFVLIRERLGYVRKFLKSENWCMIIMQ